MKKILFILSLASLSVFLRSQDLHSPAEILKILENSEITYEIDMLADPLSCPDRSEILNRNDVYRVVTDTAALLFGYDLAPEAVPYFQKAEEYFTSQNYDSALFLYQKVIETDPTYYKVMTYIGQMYGSLGDRELARKWFLKAIANNYIDYMAHWFLADEYKAMGKIDSAVNEITIALILNRNNPRIKKSRTEIFNLAKIDADDWYFVPQAEITKADENVIIKLGENWAGYGLTKALWLYEPGYKQSMGVQENLYSTLEDKECLLNLMYGLTNAKVNFKKIPGLVTLKKAIDSDFLNEYIFYEIVLPDHPNIACQLSDELISRIKEYVLNVRCR